ncbi:MAG: hypothetical protein MUE94_11725 [Verrucomicrobia bacterium]|jgi:hypothetical protein|nr:hypothetical protein [Verrucomicrobiota bacterium]
MSFLPADPLNCEIIALSLDLQRQIPVITRPDGCVVGAQQAMPKPEHANEFGPDNPLPWVPDRVGTQFAHENNGVLVVGSSYNGFIEGYSSRSMKLEDYLAIRDLIREGNEDPRHPEVTQACTNFIQDFDSQVMAPDKSTYYGPILDRLLGDAGVPASRACLTDLCKASFVQHGSNTGTGHRGDEGNDGVIKKTWSAWAQFLTCKRAGDDTPLPYEWIWRRMQQCRHIIALGTIAEYGVIKMFKRMAELPAIGTRNGGRIHLDQSLDPDARWKYCYADSTRKLSRWLDTKDWWILGDGATGKKWNLLPVYHPASRPPYADPGYARTRPVLGEMIASGACRVQGDRAA